MKGFGFLPLAQVTLKGKFIKLSNWLINYYPGAYSRKGAGQVSLSTRLK